MHKIAPLHEKVDHDEDLIVFWAQVKALLIGFLSLIVIMKSTKAINLNITESSRRARTAKRLAGQRWAWSRLKPEIVFIHRSSMSMVIAIGPNAIKPNMSHAE
jgi:hypothetical protein